MSKFIVNTKALAKEIAFIDTTVATQMVHPTMVNVLLEIVDGENLILTGTNGKAGAKTSLKLVKPVDFTASIAINCQKLVDITRLIAEENVTFSDTDKRITLTAGKGRYAFQKTFDVEAHFKPFFSIAVEGPTMEVSAEAFLKVVEMGSTFVAKDDTAKYTLSGVRMDMDENGIFGRAMDGNKAIDIVLSDPKIGRNDWIFLPNGNFPLLSALIEGADNVVIVKGENLMTFTAGTRFAKIVRDASEKTPNIVKSVDAYVQQNTTTATLDSNAVIATVRRLQTAGEGKFRKINSVIEDLALKMNCQDTMSNVVEFDEEISAETVGKASFSINALYILDFLKYVNGPVTFRVNSTLPNPVVITNDSGLRCMVSQMK